SGHPEQGKHLDGFLFSRYPGSGLVSVTTGKNAGVRLCHPSWRAHLLKGRSPSPFGGRAHLAGRGRCGGATPAPHSSPAPDSVSRAAATRAVEVVSPRPGPSAPGPPTRYRWHAAPWSPTRRPRAGGRRTTAGS